MPGWKDWLENWSPAIVSGGMSLLGGLFGGRKQKTRYEMSPEARSLLGQLKGQIGKTPSYITRPFSQRYGALRRGISERRGQALGPGSGLEGAKLMEAKAEESRVIGEAGERHQMGLLNLMASLVGGRGTQVTETGWGDVLGGIGGDIGLLWGLKQMMGQQKEGRRTV